MSALLCTWLRNGDGVWSANGPDNRNYLLEPSGVYFRASYTFASLPVIERHFDAAIVQRGFKRVRTIVSEGAPIELARTETSGKKKQTKIDRRIKKSIGVVSGNKKQWGFYGGLFAIHRGFPTRSLLCLFPIKIEKPTVSISVSIKMLKLQSPHLDFSLVTIKGVFRSENSSPSTAIELRESQKHIFDPLIATV